MNTQVHKNGATSNPDMIFRKAKTGLQAKFIINTPGDIYEQEADAMAEQVMRMSSPESQGGHVTGLIGASVQRKCSACKEEEDKKRLLMRKPTGGYSGIQASSSLVSSLNASRGSGTPLPSGTRRFMENAFSKDFLSVRVHTGGLASEMNKGINAKAFTYGSDIFFREGQYNPQTREGKNLLAHELTHVVQQSSNLNRKMIQRLGSNPNCSQAEADIIHQAIYNARGWVNNALSHMRESPTPQSAVDALRRNFGATYGVAANLQMIIDRIALVYRKMGVIPYSCMGGTNPDATCDTAPVPCGWAFPGSDAVSICRAATLASGDWIYQAGCVLHEAFHATFSRFTVDEYSGWHGHSGSSATYPGTGTDPLLNADSYTSLVIDLSGK